ncbi:hypothetical protein JRQ81_006254 [Phrynocephalus forsythii]|uniref:Diphosphomevalonate decarboxylase n=1 Tax=Phrynocephalus forsythii TaxID=171643 RepID=A0A9Q0XGD0_9SAUR|nr:hypothetical protein JRQ81_006254 [Phrynocephalus forsythii]
MARCGTELKTTTTAAMSQDFPEDRLWLNGKESDIRHPRLQSCLQEIRRLARKRHSDAQSSGDCPPLSLNYKVHIASENNFPTAAGLASSAAGYACLVYTLAQLYGVEGELSEVARRGSGSACRSMFGGFVQWLMGEEADGKDSIAQQVAPETHWPELRILILVVSAEKKPVGSTAGMQTSVETSLLLKHRASAVVPERMAEMIRHIQRRDFEAFGKLTMQESNQFHATCLDTFPPLFYLNDTSKQVIALVHRYNAHCGRTKVAYTFDAGPNAVLFMLDEVVAEFVDVVKRSFPPADNGSQFMQGLPVEAAMPSEELLSAVVRDPVPGALRYLLLTKLQLKEDQPASRAAHQAGSWTQSPPRGVGGAEASGCFPPPPISPARRRRLLCDSEAGEGRGAGGGGAFPAGLGEEEEEQEGSSPPPPLLLALPARTRRRGSLQPWGRRESSSSSSSRATGQDGAHRVGHVGERAGAGLRADSDNRGHRGRGWPVQELAICCLCNSHWGFYLPAGVPSGEAEKGIHHAEMWPAVSHARRESVWASHTELLCPGLSTCRLGCSNRIPAGHAPGHRLPGHREWHLLTGGHSGGGVATPRSEATRAATDGSHHQTSTYRTTPKAPSGGP